MTLKSKQFLYWTRAIVWAAVIFLTLPFAREWTDWITEKFTGYFIPIVVVAILVYFLVFSVVRLIKDKAGFVDCILLAIVTAGYVYANISLEILIEQIHFLEYGILAYYFIKAIRLSRTDPGGYIIAMVLVTLIGVIDEYIQGILPDIVGELHDVYLNILSGVLALCWYRIVLKPVEEKKPLRSAWAVSLPLIGLIIFIMGVFNSKISEFGHYIVDEEIGEFYTRIHPENLGKEYPDLDIFRKNILPKLYMVSYSELLHELINPVHGEILVHIFRRDRHIRDEDFITSHWENLILEKYFLPFIEGSEHHWTDEKKGEIYSLSIDKIEETYISPVSAHLITSFPERVHWVVIGIIEIIIIVGMMMLLRKRISGDAH